LVPMHNKVYCKNTVLERDKQRDKGGPHQSKILTESGKKGGLIHQTEHLQLGAKIIRTKTQQTYKVYQWLKGDKG